MNPTTRTQPLLFAPDRSHPSHAMHANSVKANATVDHTGREREVLYILRTRGVPLTDRQICEELGQHDLNYCRPAITRLIDAGTLAEVGNVKCTTTGRTVRQVQLAGWQSNLRASR